MWKHDANLHHVFLSISTWFTLCMAPPQREQVINSTMDIHGHHSKLLTPWVLGTGTTGTGHNSSWQQNDTKLRPQTLCHTISFFNAVLVVQSHAGVYIYFSIHLHTSPMHMKILAKCLCIPMDPANSNKQVNKATSCDHDQLPLVARVTRGHLGSILLVEKDWQKHGGKRRKKGSIWQN